MKPVLFEIFGLKIYGYGTMIAIGIFVAVMMLLHRSRKRGYDEDSILNMAIAAVICGILGGKLLFIITEFKSMVNDPSLLKDIGNGFVVYGAIAGGALGALFYAKRKKWNILKTFDMLIPGVAIAQGFGRIGCFLAGCCYGKETSLPIGVEFENSLFAPAGVHLHPTQIYMSLFDFALGFFLLWYDKKEHEEGRTFSLYIMIYSVGRIIVEFLRDDPRGSVGPLSTSQFIGIFTLAIGLALYNLHKIKRGNEIEKE